MKKRRKLTGNAQSRTDGQIRQLDDIPPVADCKSHDLMELTAWIVASFVSNHSLPAGELPGLIQLTYKALAELDRMGVDRARVNSPAVPIEESVADDYIVCLEDGRRLKILKRYIRRQYALTPEQYRTRWGLPSNYPMVAPSYARLRSALAKRRARGLGSDPEPAPKDEPP